MAIKNLLIAYNGGPASNAALSLAVLMAQKYDAHLTGVLAHGVSKVSRNIPGWFSDEIRNSIKGAISQKANDIKERFFATTSAALSDDKLHWIEVGGDPDQTIADYAMLFDITLVGEYEGLVEADELELHPDRIALQCGRPVIWVPKTYSPNQFNERAVLAWDGNRVATRALAGAMPVLETKESVAVATVESAHVGTPLTGIDVITVLTRHDIPAERIVVPNKGRSIASTLKSICDQQEAGLLVIGAFERSKFRHDIAGGVTTEVLKQSKIPVLMSH